jgi:dTDP-4-amino-4,6-dideoxygalactose transaminase/predicted dehydrogenase
MIPLVDLKAQFEGIEEEVKEAISQVLKQTNFILGEPVAQFEKSFAEFCGAKYCVGVASGTDALYLSLKALGIGSGDEVIIPANTFVATALAVSYTGATPILVDADEATFNIDLTKIEEKITLNTKAIIPVHLYGRPVEMEGLTDIANRYGLYVIEDACQAHGARWSERAVGSFGVIGCFSFYPGKNLGAYGDGGAIVTSDETIYEKLKMLRNYGSPKKYYHEIVGYNSRLDTIQAAVLNVKLKYLKEWNNKRRQSAALYNKKLADIKEVIVPQIPSGQNHVFHLYVVRAKKRDELLKYLNDNGVQAGIHYPVPIYSLGAYAHFGWNRDDFPITEKLAREIISLPLYPELTEDKIDQITALIKNFYTPRQFFPAATAGPAKDKVVFGLIGYGYWGPNLARNIYESKNCEFKRCADLSEANLAKAKEKYPQVITTTNYRDVLNDRDINAVVVATPTKTHYAIVKDCLMAKKHVLVEKPLTDNVATAEELEQMAGTNGVKLMVGHVFLYNSAVHYIKDFIDQGHIGRLRHLHFQRRNLGPIRQDINVMWDLAPHDISMALYFIGKDPISVVASGESYLQNHLGQFYDVVSVSIKFPENIMANMIFSWIDPIKIRDLTIVGDQKMILFDDVNMSEKIKIFNKNAQILKNTRDVSFGDYTIAIHAGEIAIPAVNYNEPLKEEIAHFIDCILRDHCPRTDGLNGLAVVRVAEAIQKSLDHNSAVIYF